MPFYNLVNLQKVREEMSPLAEIQRVKGELMKAGLVTYRKGEFARPHYHPNDEQFVFVLEGTRYSILGDEERLVGPGYLLHIPRNTRHGGISLSDKAVLFAVKSPAGSGVMGEDYHEAKDADDVEKRLLQKLKEYDEGKLF
jgi:quercetin dioxygenase-like cupin family protein